jgi:hypothetical protein
MGDLPEIVYGRSVEIIGVARHLLGKPERMAAHDDLMILDRAIGTARSWRTAP